LPRRLFRFASSGHRAGAPESSSWMAMPGLIAWNTKEAMPRSVASSLTIGCAEPHRPGIHLLATRCWCISLVRHARCHFEWRIQRRCVNLCDVGHLFIHTMAGTSSLPHLVRVGYRSAKGSCPCLRSPSKGPCRCPRLGSCCGVCRVSYRVCSELFKVVAMALFLHLLLDRRLPCRG
jgi:hypothetical protein